MRTCNACAVFTALQPLPPRQMLASRSRGCCLRHDRVSTSVRVATLRRPVVHRRVVTVLAHGHGAATGVKMAGFVGEMRRVAMKLHTREQAPKEGGVEAPKRNKPWAPSLKGYLQFLAESKVVYETFEDVLKDEKHPEYARFRNTGLERSQPLAEDIAWYTQQYNLPQPEIKPDGPGMKYAKHLRELAAKDPQDFICHFYNYFFAHTAGGRMIGQKLAGSLLGGTELKFYQYDADVNQLLDKVRADLNDLAESWTREQKDHCLQETADAFKWSGAVMACMTEEEE